MSQQLVGVGSVANDGTGDKLRDAYIKLNSNFTELYGLLDRNIKSVTQSSHGFGVKDVLRVTTSGAYAKISDPYTQEPVGLVTAVADGNNFTMVEDGFVSTLSALTANTVYYVQSSGALGTTPTSLKYFHATSATSGHILKSSRNGNLTLAQVLSNGADANGVAITNLADPTSDQDAATKVWTLAQISTPSLSSVLAVGADANATAITNLADPTYDQDAATKAYVMAQISSSLDLENVLTNDNDAGGLAIANLADPTSDQDAATKAYVLAQISTPSLASVLGVDNDANAKRIVNLADPTGDQDAATRGWVINNFGIPSIAEVLDFNNDANGELITNLSDPVNGQDAATKAYVLARINDIATGQTVFDTDLKSFEQDDFLTSANTYVNRWSTITSGTGSGVSKSQYGVDSIERAIGVVKFSTGTDTSGLSGAISDTSRLELGKGHSFVLRQRAAIETLSDGTDTFTVRVGWIYNDIGEPDNGVFFRYTHGVNSGKWQCVTRDNTTETATDSGVTADTLFSVFDIRVNADGTSASFYINNVLVGTITTNIPVASGRYVSMGLHILKSAGTTSRNLHIDWYDLLISRTSAR